MTTIPNPWSCQWVTPAFPSVQRKHRQLTVKGKVLSRPTRTHIALCVCCSSSKAQPALQDLSAEAGQSATPSDGRGRLDCLLGPLSKAD